MNQQKVLLILAGENHSVDDYALIHLEDYVRRKIADEAVILTADEVIWKRAMEVNFPFPVKVHQASGRELLLLHDYYCFEEYFENIAFTYIDRPKDNLLGRLLRETDINEEEAVCFGCYCLRMIPKHDIKR